MALDADPVFQQVFELVALTPGLALAVRISATAGAGDLMRAVVETTVFARPLVCASCLPASPSRIGRLWERAPENHRKRTCEAQLATDTCGRAVEERTSQTQGLEPRAKGRRTGEAGRFAFRLLRATQFIQPVDPAEERRQRRHIHSQSYSASLRVDSSTCAEVFPGRVPATSKWSRCQGTEMLEKESIGSVSTRPNHL